jgi:hypothetical protein
MPIKRGYRQSAHFPTCPVTASVVARLDPTCANGGTTANPIRAQVGSGLVARAKSAMTWAVFREASVLAWVVAFTLAPISFHVMRI